MNKLNLTLFCLALSVLACQTPATDSQEAQSTTVIDLSTQPDMPLPLELALEAHGGLDRWQGYKALEYDLEVLQGEKSSVQHSVVDLNSRHERILYETYEMGYDGEEFWYHADTIPEEHPDPKFYINLQFYFFALPFVLSDPGIEYEDLGKRAFEEKMYDVIKVTYKDGVGQASKDQYLLYLDPETHRLHLLLYSVTYFNAENATQYNAAVYEDWQEVDGLWVPSKMTSHKWDAETEEIGEVRYIKTFRNIRFSLEAPAEQLFHKPEGAEVS